MKTFSELLKQADNTGNIDELADLYEKFISNRKSFSLVEVEFGEEHFMLLARKLAKRDANLIKDALGI